jgi:predicted dehydrogenase
VALVGAGGFGGRVIAPALAKAGARLKTIVSRGGVSSVTEGRKAGFEDASTDFPAVLDDPEIDTVAIATRHDSHASLALKAIAAGKNVFVEKPLAIELDDIHAITQALDQREKGGKPVRLMVGFNRRFSRFSVKMKNLLDGVREPKCLVALINAGAVRSNHWTQDPAEGGGRIVGEACHFIDLMRFFVGAPIVAAHVTPLGRPTADGVGPDKVTMTLSFEDGSIATIHYFANGPKSLRKERFEAFAGGRYLRLDNFRSLSGNGWSRNPGMRGAQDKGHEAALAAFINSIRHGTQAPIPLDEILETSRWSILAARQAAG